MQLTSDESGRPRQKADVENVGEEKLLKENAKCETKIAVGGGGNKKGKFYTAVNVKWSVLKSNEALF